ncbi:MAG: hypothetical protein MZU95_02030 [Desulfomicrobium escambiense]|nr:hypothetical protein [Desulfomicrobium escambiense]
MRPRHRRRPPCAISCSSSPATTVIAFDFEEALSFEGETRALPAVHGGPPEQHLPQAQRALRRRRADIRPPADGRALIRPGLSDQETADFWDLVLTACLPRGRRSSARSPPSRVLAPGHVRLSCSARSSTAITINIPILAEENGEIRAFRLLVLLVCQGPAPSRARPHGHPPARADVTQRLSPSGG